MRHFYHFVIAFFITAITSLSAQLSPDCGNAIPICNDTPVNGGTDGFGVDDFNGAEMNGCLEETTSGAIESNSAWYRFRTGASGQLGFNIGIDTSEDWDFALYKTDVCSNLDEPIRCNFFDNTDQDGFIGIGEDPTGDESNIQYEDWIQVEPGEDYFLLINNFSNVNSGFSIQFSGNIFITNPFDALDCSIVTNLLGPPISQCEGFNATLNATISNALSYDWFRVTETGEEQIIGENSPVLVVSTSATYRVKVARPTGFDVISDVQVGFSAMPTALPLTDAPACTGDTVFDLSEKDSETLGTQNPEEFLVSYHNTLLEANSGENALPKLFTIPSAIKTIYVRVGSIRNSDCYDASQQFRLIPIESPIVDFPSEVFLCDGESSIAIGALVDRPFHTYSWDSGETSSNIDVAQAGTYTITVSNTQNGVSCIETVPITVVVSNPPMISNIEVDDLKEENTVTIYTAEEGNWQYSIDGGDYQSSPIFNDVLPGSHFVTVNDLKGCGSDTEQLVVVGFPKFFTPNGDNMNDIWSIAGVGTLENPLVSIYDRYGKLLTQLTGNGEGWDGTLNGMALPSSDYWFKLTYKDTDGQITEAKYINNHFTLKR
jgi:gliding motility-associated-like protein